MTEAAILLLATFFQLAATLVALSQMRPAGRFWPFWGCIAAALGLMVVRRALPLWASIAPGVSVSHITNELIGLLISILMLGGVIGLRALFKRLRQSEELLAQSNRDLEQFAYVASHDLQEPLRMVSSYLGLIERRLGPRLDDEEKEFLHFASDGATRMQRMIRALLDYSRISTRGKPPTPIAMNQALEEALKNLKNVISETGALVTHAQLPTLPGDPVQMVSLLQNLIGNAIKYRRPEVSPKVRIDAVRDGKVWLFSVSDNGIGISPENFGRLFVIFQRLNPRETYEGTGIGLAQCRRIVERHGGRIWVESVPDEGSVFKFTLPATEP